MHVHIKTPFDFHQAPIPPVHTYVSILTLPVTHFFIKLHVPSSFQRRKIFAIHTHIYHFSRYKHTSTYEILRTEILSVFKNQDRHKRYSNIFYVRETSHVTKDHVILYHHSSCTTARQFQWPKLQIVPCVSLFKIHIRRVPNYLHTITPNSPVRLGLSSHSFSARDTSKRHDSKSLWRLQCR